MQKPGLDRIQLWILLIMAFLLPFKVKGAGLLPAAYFIFWILGSGYKGMFASLKNNKPMLFLVGFYLFHVIGMLWTSNTNDGLFDLQVKFSLFFIPLILISENGISSDVVRKVLRWFILGSAVSLLACLSRAVLSDQPDSFFYTNFSWFMHPGYFSMYLCFALATILYDRNGISEFKLFRKEVTWVLTALFISGILLLSSKTGLVLLLCILIWYVYKEFISGSGKKAAFLLVMIFAGVLALSQATPYIRDRILEVELAFKKNPAETDVHSSLMRIQVWESALAIIRQHPIEGTGTGDIIDELVHYYRQHGYNKIADTELNAHNQFLQSFAALGIGGIFLLAGVVLLGLRTAFRNRNMVLGWFLIVFTVFSLFESVLEVQAGVMFFGMLFPLLAQRVALPVTKTAPFDFSGKSLIAELKEYAVAHPLRLALAAGFLIRLVAVIFSRGFGMHDDHFLVIEASQAWVDGTDYDNWLPAHGGVKPDGHSFFYSGLHFIYFHILKFCGVHDPQYKMFFVRLVHALLSLGTIYFGFKIAYKISNLKSASIVGWLLAFLWFMPWLSVRNLVEVACIPFLLWGAWLMISADDRSKPHKFFFLAGMLFGIAFSIRFQTVLFIGGAGLALLFMQRIKDAVSLGLGTLLVFTATQAPVDYVIWGSPFAQFWEYVLYNLDNAYNYIVGPWYNYTLLILGILIPPVSFFLFFGWLRQWKKHLLLFLPVFVFLAFHSYFPNKQERFILPVVPFFIIMGIPGWNQWFELRERSKVLKNFVKGAWVFFIVINILLLPFITTMYSKRARVESMSYLYPQRNSIQSLLMEDMNRSSAKMAPEFYLGKWIVTYEVSQVTGYDSLEFYMNKYGPAEYPQYALFLGEKNLEQRVEKLGTYFPDMQLEATIEPGFVDKVLYWLNPRNANDVIYIYRTGVPMLRPPD